MAEIVKQNPVNDPTQKPVKTHSKFTPNYSSPLTHKFGVNTPVFGVAAVADDDISVRVNADTDTYTLKAPLMVPVKRNMDYFQLPLRSLLPHAAEFIITNPLQGDDVDAAKVNATLTPSDHNKLMTKILRGITSTSLSNFSTAPLNHFKSFMKSYQLFQMVASHGSLPKYLGYSCFNHVVAKFYSSSSSLTKKPVEKLYSAVLSRVDDYLVDNEGYIQITLKKLITTKPSDSDILPFEVTFDYVYALIGNAYDTCLVPDSQNQIFFKTMRDFCEYLVECNMEVSDTDFTRLGGDPATNLFTAGPSSWAVIAARLITGGALPNSVDIIVPTMRHNLNLLKLVAYQKACAEFYSNDKVDAIYSAALYEQNEQALARYIANNNYESFYFVLNGVSIEYDACAGANIARMITALQNTDVSSTDNGSVAWAYIHNLFAFTRSLKYEDYFVGAKTQPLAVGDVTVGVDTGSSTVDIIDVSKKIQVQRFLNQVNRVGRKFSDYVKGILGDKPMKDVHEPIFLGHVVDTIGAEETDNTGEGQLSRANSTTSKFRNNASRFAFDVHVGEPSILIGIVNYDIVRAYNYVNDRENYHIDRYDAFNPYMQFVGDQEIFSDEIQPSPVDNTPFGYTMRYMEYKQRVDRAAGGFSLGELPGYAVILEPENIPAYIDSDFLRSHVGEIDQLYQVLTGYTPGELFNFIVRLDVEITANRPMAFAPSIL